MARQIVRLTLIFLVLQLVLGIGQAEAQYNYGKSRGNYGGADDQGFLLSLEGTLTNPRNADNVTATEIAGSLNSAIIPAWDEDFGLRVSFGYGWASGTKIIGSYWGTESQVDSVGTAQLGGVLAFAIGPPIATGGDFIGDSGSPGVLQIDTEISAQVLDVYLARSHAFNDTFSLEWSAGLRYANFEETHQGRYDEAGSFIGVNSYRVDKSNEGDMAGVKLGVRGVYRIGRFSAEAGLGFSMLDGELEASSSLVPNGTSNGSLTPSLALVSDDGRSGTIRDFDVAGSWHVREDMIRLSLGYESSEWEDIASDLVRNHPGTIAPLRDRDSVTFSSVKLGLHFRF